MCILIDALCPDIRQRSPEVLGRWSATGMLSPFSTYTLPQAGVNSLDTPVTFGAGAAVYSLAAPTAGEPQRYSRLPALPRVCQTRLVDKHIVAARDGEQSSGSDSP